MGPKLSCGNGMLAPEGLQCCPCDPEPDIAWCWAASCQCHSRKGHLQSIGIIPWFCVASVHARHGFAGEPPQSDHLLPSLLVKQQAERQPRINSNGWWRFIHRDLETCKWATAKSRGKCFCLLGKGQRWHCFMPLDNLPVSFMNTSLTMRSINQFPYLPEMP